MVERLSIKTGEDEQEITLSTSREDIGALLIKVLGNLIPFGGAFAEVITALIPHQKIDRVIRLVEKLNYKFEHEPRKINAEELKTPEFRDLFEDGFIAATRALSEDRLEFIATLLTKSLTVEEIKHDEKKKLLGILNALTDSEVVWLKSFNLDYDEQDKFYERHKEIFDFEPGVMGMSEMEMSRETIATEYRRTLQNLNLIDDKRRLTRLGRFFLHFIGQIKDFD
ncbi:MAG TPA: hypothetical protein VIL74_20550 [Pyrinomonadaceae bacterium]|jgi:hypothetical protein